MAECRCRELPTGDAGLEPHAAPAGVHVAESERPSRQLAFVYSQGDDLSGLIHHQRPTDER